MPPFVLEIIDENGRTIGQIIDDGDEFGLTELWAKINRSQSGMDQKLFEVMEELGIRTDEPPF